MPEKISALERTISAIRRAIRNVIVGTDGSALVELTLFAPILLMTAVFTMDLGLAIYHKMQVQHAAQAGVQYTISHGSFDSAAITSAVTNATTYAGISATPAPSQFCGCRSNSGVTSATCGATCTDGSTAGNYVRVSSQATHSTIVRYPGMPNSFSFTSQSTVRIP
jgi:Flp pilus assembly protein TadG